MNQFYNLILLRKNHLTDTSTAAKNKSITKITFKYIYLQFERGNATNPPDSERIPSIKETIHAEMQELHSSHFVQPTFARNRSLDGIFIY